MQKASPQDELLSVELLKKALLTTAPDSRQRRGMTIAFNALLAMHEIDSDLNKYKVDILTRPRSAGILQYRRR